MVSALQDESIKTVYLESLNHRALAGAISHPTSIPKSFELPLILPKNLSSEQSEGNSSLAGDFGIFRSLTLDGRSQTDVDGLLGAHVWKSPH